MPERGKVCRILQTARNVPRLKAVLKQVAHRHRVLQPLQSKPYHVRVGPVAARHRHGYQRRVHQPKAKPIEVYGVIHPPVRRQLVYFLRKQPYYVAQ